MRRFGIRVCSVVLTVCGLAAAPAAPSFYPIEKSIEKIRADWAKPGAKPERNAPGWNALFDALVGQLRSYSSATNERDRLAALQSIYKISSALATVAWPPAAELRELLREWLRPRVRLAWAERRLVDRVHTLPRAPTAEIKGNREKWVRFVGDDLGRAIQQYDAAATVLQRQEGLKGVHAALAALQARNQASPWVPSTELQAALADLYDQKNVDISVDLPTLSPIFNVNLVRDGPVYRRGYVSQVTSGPKTGFGLLPSDDGIAFYNSQLMTSVTPIWDFQNQVAANPQGRRAAKMYQFSATTRDDSELTITTVIRPSGLAITPSYRHNVNAAIGLCPQPGAGLSRLFASVLGFNEERIRRLTYQNAIGPMRRDVEVEALEEGLERTSREAANRNAQLAQYLIGGDRAVFRNLLIEGLSLRSRPANALIAGKLTYRGGEAQAGADASQPPALARPDAGVSADLHLGSIMTNFTRGALQNEDVKKVENLLIVTEKIPPGAPPSQGIKATRNADYPTFLRAIESAQLANDPKVIAIRVKRPGRAPDFGADARGYLVAFVHDFQIEFPVPPQLAKGGLGGGLPPARVYRLSAPASEITIAFTVEAKSETEPLRLSGRIEDFDPGPGAKVYALGDDENQPASLTAFSALPIITGFRVKVKGQPIDVPLSDLKLQGFAIKSVSPLDPSGWIRVNLERTSPSPAAGLQ